MLLHNTKYCRNYFRNLYFFLFFLLCETRHATLKCLLFIASNIVKQNVKWNVKKVRFLHTVVLFKDSDTLIFSNF